MCGGLGYILPIVFLSIVYNIVKLFEVETVYHEVCKWLLHLKFITFTYESHLLSWLGVSSWDPKHLETAKSYTFKEQTLVFTLK